MCDIDIVMLFLILVSVITMAIDGEEDDCKTILSSCWKHSLSFFLLAKLKENFSGKLLTILEPRRSSGWRGENNGKILYSLLFESIRWPLMMVLWQFVSMLIEWEMGLLGRLERSSMSVLMRWLVGSARGHNWDLLASFWRWNLIGMSPVIASISFLDLLICG